MHIEKEMIQMIRHSGYVVLVRQGDRSVLLGSKTCGGRKDYCSILRNGLTPFGSYDANTTINAIRKSKPNITIKRYRMELEIPENDAELETQQFNAADSWVVLIGTKIPKAKQVKVIEYYSTHIISMNYDIIGARNKLGNHFLRNGLNAFDNVANAKEYRDQRKSKNPNIECQIAVLRLSEI